MPLNTSKMGPFFNGGGGHQLDLLVESQARTVKVVHDMTLILDLLERMPTTTFIHKGWDVPSVTGDPLNDDVQRWGGYNDPYGAAVRWWNYTKETLERIPFHHRHRVYTHISNEFADWDNLDRMAWFEAECVKLMGKAGFRACAGEFAVGTPEYDRWPDVYRLLEALSEYNGALGLHEYFPYLGAVYVGNNQADNLRRGVFERHPEGQWGHLCLRAVKVYADHIEGRFEVPIFITEFGMGAALGGPGIQEYFGQSGVAYQDSGPVLQRVLGRSGWEVYEEEIAWYDREIQRYPFIQGAHLYTVTDWDADSAWNLKPEEVTAFYNYIKRHRRD